MTAWKGSPNFLDQIQGKELVLTDNSSPTKGITFGDATRQLTAGIEGKYALQSIEIPFTYANVGLAPPEEYIAIDHGGTTMDVYKWSGAVWNALPSPYTALGARLPSGIWGIGGKLWANFSVGTLSLCYYDGAAWSKPTLASFPAGCAGSPGIYNKANVHGSATDNVWHTRNTTSTNSVFRWDGATWTAKGSAVISAIPYPVWTGSLSSVWLGPQQANKAWYYNGTIWTEYTLPITLRCSGIYGSAANDLMFLGQDANSPYKFKAYHWDGANFVDTTPAYWDTNSCELWVGFAQSSSDIVVGGWAGTSFGDRVWAYWNGSSWTTARDAGTRVTILDMGGMANNDFITNTRECQYTPTIRCWTGSWADRATPYVATGGTNYALTKSLGPSLDPLQSTETIPIGARILRSRIAVDTPFVGSPVIELSVVGNSVLQDTTTDYLDLAVARQYDKTTLTNITVAGKVQCRLTGSASAGVGRVLVDYLVPRS